MDRRRFLASATTTAAATWAAPAILRVDRARAAPGSCLPDGLVWTDYSFRLDDFPSYSGSESTVMATALTTVDLTAQFYGGPSPGGWGPVEPSPGTQGATAPHLSLQLDSFTPVGGYVDLTFTFSPEVWDLRFTLLDIDAYWKDFRDQVAILSATGSLGAAGYTYTAGTTVTGTGNPFVAQCRTAPPENKKRCRPDVAATETLGNAALYFANPVEQLSLRYEAARPPGAKNPAGQELGISNLTFCVLPGAPAGTASPPAGGLGAPGGATGRGSGPAAGSGPG